MSTESTPVTAFLHRHEQMSAWLFFSAMSFMVMRYGISSGSLNMDLRYDYDTSLYHIIGSGWMQGVLPYSGLSDLKGPLLFLIHGLGSLLTPCSHAGAMLLHSLLLGVWMLYCLKTAALYMRRSTAWAITGLLFAYTLQMAAGPTEMTMVFQTVTLYHILVWSRGRKEFFCDRHLFLAGAGAAAALLTKFNLVVFWAPVIPLMLWCNRKCLLRSMGMAAAGIALPLLLFAGYFLYHGALGSLWQEYIQTAILYGSSIPFVESALVQENIRIFRLLPPELLIRSLPLPLLVAVGMALSLLWIIPAGRGRPGRGRAAVLALGAAWLLGAIASFGGPYAFLHYSFYYNPYILLSLIGTALILHKVVKNENIHNGLRIAGLMIPMLTLGIGLGIPVYVSLAKPEKGIAQLRDNVQGVSRMIRRQRASFVVSDARHLTVIYRKAGAIPPIRHLTPQMTPGGEETFRQELVECLASQRPDYVISSDCDVSQAEECIRRSGVRYRRLDLQQMGMPRIPATSPYPAPIVYQRDE